MNAFSGARSLQSPQPKAQPVVASSQIQPTIINDAERIASAERFVQHLKKGSNDHRFSKLDKTLSLTNASAEELQILAGHLGKGAQEFLQGHTDWLKDIHHAPTMTYGPAIGCDYGRPYFLSAYHEVDAAAKLVSDMIKSLTNSGIHLDKLRELSLELCNWITCIRFLGSDSSQRHCGHSPVWQHLKAQAVREEINHDNLGKIGQYGHQHLFSAINLVRADMSSLLRGFDEFTLGKAYWRTHETFFKGAQTILNKHTASSLIFEWAKEELHPEAVVRNFEYSTSKKVMDYLKSLYSLLEEDTLKNAILMIHGHGSQIKVHLEQLREKLEAELGHIIKTFQLLVNDKFYTFHPSVVVQRVKTWPGRAAELVKKPESLTTPPNRPELPVTLAELSLNQHQRRA